MCYFTLDSYLFFHIFPTQLLTRSRHASEFFEAHCIIGPDVYILTSAGVFCLHRNEPPPQQQAAGASKRAARRETWFVTWPDVALIEFDEAAMSLVLHHRKPPPVSRSLLLPDRDSGHFVYEVFQRVHAKHVHERRTVQAKSAADAFLDGLM